MLDVLNLLFLAGTVASQALNIVALSESDIEIQPGVRVYAVSMKQQAPMWVDKCRYDGVMVEYARDWEEVDPATGFTVPPEPGKPIGYALILTRERCPGKEGRPIFHADSKVFSPLFGRNYVIREGNRMDAIDYAGQPDEMRPKWMPQVLRTLEAEAERNEPAKEFMAMMRQRSQATDGPKVPVSGGVPSSEPEAQQ